MSRLRHHPVALAVVALLGFLAAWARRTRAHNPTPGLPARVTSTVVADDGRELYVEIGGQEDTDLTVVLVHGFLARSAEFDPQWEHLWGRVRLVRYDHRGHGRSGRSTRASDIDQLGRDLGRVIDDTTPTGPVVLVGHSMGGISILALAEQRPELIGDRVQGVGLLGSGAGHYIDGHPIENAVRFLSRRGAFGPMLLVLRLLSPIHERLRPRNTRLMRAVTRFLLFGSADANPSLVAQVHAMLGEPPLSTAAGLHGALLRHDKRAALAVLRRVPVVIVAGDDDRLTRIEHSYAMKDDIGQSAELVVLPGVGHALTRSAPHEVNAALDDLLARVRQSRRLETTA
jgi:pimeloyl-ACP methyl ester carboxylesterase